MPSTLIRAFSHDPQTAILEVTFVSGAVYHYYDVPADVAQNMREAFAKGEFFNQRIRGRYRFARVKRLRTMDDAQAARVRKVIE
jgi:hypothetical protein